MKLLICLGLLTLPLGGQDSNEELLEKLEALRERSGAPALAGAVFDAKVTLREAWCGRTEVNGKKEVTAESLWHIGSDTKAMTATLAGVLVKEGELSWGTALEMQNGSRLTLKMLLSHRAGLPTDAPEDFRENGFQVEDRNVRRQRAELAKIVQKMTLKTSPGEAYHYSNLGYTMAAYLMEEATGKAWEKLIEEKIFQPLRMKTPGYGAPEEKGEPRGHTIADGVRIPAERGWSGDNPAFDSPAGGVHLSLADWISFLQEHLKGARDKGILLEGAGYRILHTPVGDNAALGWIKVEDILAHSGSNTMWYATARLDLKTGKGVVLVSNDAAPATTEGMENLAWELIDEE